METRIAARKKSIRTETGNFDIFYFGPDSLEPRENDGELTFPNAEDPAAM